MISYRLCTVEYLLEASTVMVQDKEVVQSMGESKRALKQSLQIVGTGLERNGVFQ